MEASTDPSSPAFVTARWKRLWLRRSRLKSPGCEGFLSFPPPALVFFSYGFLVLGLSGDCLVLGCRFRFKVFKLSLCRRSSPGEMRLSDGWIEWKVLDGFGGGSSVMSSV